MNRDIPKAKGTTLEVLASGWIVVAVLYFALVGYSALQPGPWPDEQAHVTIAEAVHTND